MHNLSDEQRVCLTKMGFEKMVHFNVDGIPSKLAYFVVDVFDPEEMVIRLKHGNIRITKEVINEILGVSIKGKPVEYGIDDVIEATIEDDWESKYISKKITAKDIMEQMCISNDADRQFEINFIMLFCTTMIKCNKSGVCNLNLVKTVSRKKRYDDLDWGCYIYDALKSCKKGWRREDKNCAFTGPLTLLTLIYLVGTKCPIMKKESSTPPIKMWNMAYMRVREEEELQSGGFGQGELVSKYVEKATTEEEYNIRLQTTFEKLIYYRDSFGTMINKARSVFPDSALLSEHDQKFRRLFTLLRDSNQEISSLSAEMIKEASEKDIKDTERSPLSDFWTDNTIMDKLDEQIELIMSKKKEEEKKNAVTPTPPSFSLGISQDYVSQSLKRNVELCAAIDEDMDFVDHMTLGQRLQAQISKTPTVKIKRKKEPTSIMRSPYVNRIVDISRGTSADEKKIWSFLFRPVGNEEELIFSTEYGYATGREAFETFQPDCWVLSQGMLENKNMNDETIIELFRENLLHIIGCQSDLLSLATFDLVFFPVIDNGHYYLICFDLKTPSIVVIDNINHQKTTMEIEGGVGPMEERKTNIPTRYRDIFGKYLEIVGNPKSFQIQSADPLRLSLKWSTSENSNDCGIFLMRHMECYKGISKQWDCGFEPEGRKQSTQILRLRCKYAAKILLSELNIHRATVLSDTSSICEELQNLKRLKKRKQADAVVPKNLRSKSLLIEDYLC
ncbi:hypothetical protein L1987_63805 [Smallanthus sonchifolius]|uniref:Uncharacterized protein n=1 Tax=Smallanthus sonchifolius TaxID=185202 RepID=A0ACB9CE89_9ASTR|nr:hypothetical protein L1987_63805 [Smallanthus sonchifolius]